MDTSYFVHRCLMFKYESSVCHMFIFYNVNFFLIMSNRIPIFSMCVPCKVLMPVIQFLFDLNLFHGSE